MGVLFIKNVLHCVFCINLVIPSGYLSDTNQVSCEKMILFLFLFFSVVMLVGKALELGVSRHFLSPFGNPSLKGLKRGKQNFFACTYALP